MMRNTLLLLAVLESATAFTACPPPPLHGSSSNTALHLTPKQGPQLVDAYNAAHADDEDPEVYHPSWYKHGHTKQEQHSSQHEHLRSIATSSSSSRHHGGVSEKARTWVHRLVTLPLTSHPHDDEDKHLYDDEHHDHDGIGSIISEQQDDVVYYPVIGFTYVPDAEDHSRALPTISNPSCRLVYEQLLDKQEVFGEWHPATKNVKQHEEATSDTVIANNEGPQP